MSTPSSEKAVLEHFYPIFAGLDVAHVNYLISTDALDPSGTVDRMRPMLVKDGSGETVFENAAWRDQTAATVDIEGILRRLVNADSDQTMLGEGRILQRTRTSSAHVFAPNGLVFTIERRPVDVLVDNRNLISNLHPELTRREIDIVALILDGYPTITIAQRLGIRSGTVKNHRVRIFDKMDITTERELFTSYIELLLKQSGK